MAERKQKLFPPFFINFFEEGFTKFLFFVIMSVIKIYYLIKHTLGLLSPCPPLARILSK